MRLRGGIKVGGLFSGVVTVIPGIQQRINLIASCGSPVLLDQYMNYPPSLTWFGNTYITILWSPNLSILITSKALQTPARQQLILSLKLKADQTRGEYVKIMRLRAGTP